MPHVIVWSNSENYKFVPDDSAFNIQVPCEGEFRYSTINQMELNIRAALGASRLENYEDAHVYVLNVDQSVINKINLARENYTSSYDKARDKDGHPSFNFQLQLAEHQYEIVCGYNFSLTKDKKPVCTTFGVEMSNGFVKNLLADYFGKKSDDVLITKDNVALPPRPERSSGSSLFLLGFFLSLTVIGLVVGIPLMYEGIKRIKHDEDIDVNLAAPIDLLSQVEKLQKTRGKKDKDFVSEVTASNHLINVNNERARKKGTTFPVLKLCLQKAIDEGNKIIITLERLEALIEGGQTELQDQLDKIKPLNSTAQKTINELIDYAREAQKNDRNEAKKRKVEYKKQAAEAALRAVAVQVASKLQATTPVQEDKKNVPLMRINQKPLIHEKRVCQAILNQMGQIKTAPSEKSLATMKERFEKAHKTGTELLAQLSLIMAKDTNHHPLDKEFIEREQKAFKEYPGQFANELKRIKALMNPPIVLVETKIETNKLEPVTLVDSGASQKSSSLKVTNSMFAKAATFINNDMSYDVNIEVSRYEDDRLLIKPAFVANRRQKLDRPKHSTILLADVSGSMEKAQPQLRETIKRLTEEQLPKGDLITIITFGKGGRTILKSLVIGSPDFDKEFEKAMIQINCNESQTDITAAFKQLAPESLIPDRTRIVLLTDGRDNSKKNPTHETLSKLVQDKLGVLVPVDTIGMTTSINQILLSNLSQNTKGAQMFVKDQLDIEQALYDLGMYLGGDKTTEGSVTLFKNGVELQKISFPQIPMGKSSSQVFDCALEEGEYTLSYNFGEVSFEKKIVIDKAIQYNPRVIARQIESEFAKLIAPGETLESDKMNAGLDALLKKIEKLNISCEELDQVKSSIEVYKTAFNAHDYETTMNTASVTGTVTHMGGRYLGNNALHQAKNPATTPICI